MAKKTETFEYRKASAELERVLAELQNPDIQIDVASSLHAQGLKLIAEIEAYLNQAENDVKTHSSE